MRVLSEGRRGWLWSSEEAVSSQSPGSLAWRRFVCAGGDDSRLQCLCRGVRPAGWL